MAKKDNFAGLTAQECCKACTAERCIISGINVCSHPAKGGLQGALMAQPDTLKRYQAAQAKLKRARG